MGTLCQSHISAGDWESAGRVALQARESVESLRSEEAMDPPIPIKVENILKNSFCDIRQVEFRIDIWKKFRDSNIRGEEMVDAVAVADAIQFMLCGGVENIYFEYPSDLLIMKESNDKEIIE